MLRFALETRGTLTGGAVAFAADSERAGGEGTLLADFLALRGGRRALASARAAAEQKGE
jgi:hypothetical protein